MPTLTGASSLFVLALAASAFSQGSAVADPASDAILVVRAGSLWNGSTLLHGRSLLVKDGKIAAIGGPDLPVPEGGREIAVSGSWVLPGLVLADSVTFTGQDPAPEAVTAALIAADGFEARDPRPRTAAAGILTAYLAPGRQRLIPGQGSVVRIAPSSAERAVIKAQAALHIVLTGEAYGAPLVYRPSVPPGPDNPVRPAERQFPSARGGAMADLRELFARAKEPRDLMAEESPDLGPLNLVPGQGLALRVRAERSPEIKNAITLATELDARLIIEGGTEAWKHATELATIKAGVILRSGTPLFGKLEPPPPFVPERGTGNPAAAAILAKAGVAVALCPASDTGFKELLWYAAASLGDGFSWADVLRSVTADAADLLGVGAESGRVEPGRAADLVIYDTDPLEASSKPVLVIADGRVVHDRRNEEGRAIAITARRVYTGDGAPIERGTVVVQDGKIVAVGRDVTIPAGAERVDAGDGVLVPGFIDAGGQAGLKSLRDLGEGQQSLGPPPLFSGLEQRPHAFFDPSFPDVRAAAESGVTTMAVWPSGGRPTSGVVSILKMSAADGKKGVISEIGGLFLDYSGIAWSAEEEDKLRKQFEAGKKYADSFEKYEKELKEWNAAGKAGGEVPQAAERKIAAPTPPSLFDQVSGHYAGTVFGDGIPAEGATVTLDFRLEGGRVKGIVVVKDLAPDGVAVDAEIKGRHLETELTLGLEKIKVKVEFLREELLGSYVSEGAEKGEFRLRRKGPPKPPVEKSEEKKADDKKIDEKKSDEVKPEEKKADEKKADEKKQEEKKPDEKKPDDKKPSSPSKKKPEPPKRNESLEPYRILLKGDVPVFLSSRSERLARRLLDVLRNEFEVRTVFLSPEHLPALLETLDDLGVALSPVGDALREEEGRLLNPVLLAVRKRIPVILRSGWNGDARTLYGAASWAVRTGLDPDDALRMLTKWSALVLNIQNRVGSIEKGKDADLVILGGDPFRPGSRVRRVMVSGRFVDAEKGNP